MFPAGSIIYTDYIPRLDITPNYLIPEPTSNHTYAAGACSATCYVMHNAAVYSSTFSDSRTTGNNTPPTCTGGVCVDGGVTWTWARALPGTPYMNSYSNIIAWKVTGDPAGATKAFVNGDAYAAYPQYGQFSKNLYSKDGSYLSKATAGHTFAQWLALTGGAGSLLDVGVALRCIQNSRCAGHHAQFRVARYRQFRIQHKLRRPGNGQRMRRDGRGTVSPACGLGFVPWDYSNVGAH